MNSQQVTVAQLIEILSKLPQDAKVWVEGDYGVYHCEGAKLDGDRVYVEIG